MDKFPNSFRRTLRQGADLVRQAAGQVAGEIRTALRSPRPTSETAPEQPPAPPESPAADPLQQREEAIHRAFWKEDGFRFFAEKFCRYVHLILPGEQDVQAMWIGGYNSCLDPIRYQIGKLRKTLPQTASLPKNQALWDAMLRFALRAEAEGLHCPQGWTPEDYRAALIRYGTDLQQFLDTVPSPENL